MSNQRADTFSIDGSNITKCQRFLELAKTPPRLLPELIRCNEGHLISGFSMEDLLPSVQFVRSTIRYVLYRTLGIGAEGKLDESTRSMYRGSCEIHLRNLEALVYPDWKERLPPYIRQDFLMIAKTAKDAARSFLDVYRSPQNNWPNMATCRWCQGYFVVENEEEHFCSELCKEKHVQVKDGKRHL